MINYIKKFKLEKKFNKIKKKSKNIEIKNFKK